MRLFGYDVVEMPFLKVESSSNLLEELVDHRETTRIHLNVLNSLSFNGHLRKDQLGPQEPFMMCIETFFEGGTAFL